MNLRLLAAAPLLVLAAGCGSRTPLATDGCFDVPPTCVRPGDPCGGSAAVDAVCDAQKHVWSCPPAASVYARAVDSPGVCLPFHDPAGPLQALRSSLPRVPLDDGRCLWIGESVVTTAGQSVWNAGFLVEPRASFGSCPTTATFAGGSPSSVVTMEGAPDSTLVVQIAGGYRMGGRTRVLYRLFRQDASATFGLTLLGAGLGRWDQASGQIVVPPASELRWGPDLDLGDASLVQGNTAYLWGCHAPFHDLTDDCVVSRLDAADEMQLYAGQGQWITSTRASDAAVVFDSASWFSSVVPFGGSLEHAYIVAWGSTVQTHTAPAPEGPWVAGANLADCDLPADDSHAYCSGLVVHAELQDPERPGEQVMTYSIGTLASDQSDRYASHPEKYWPRLVWTGR
jgi:hypothetical protein